MRQNRGRLALILIYGSCKIEGVWQGNAMGMASWGHKARRFISSARLWSESWLRNVLSLTLLGAAMVLPSASRPASNHLQTAVQLISQGDLNGAEKEARLALNSSEERAPAWGV